MVKRTAGFSLKRPVRRLEFERPDADGAAWPWTIPAVAQLADGGLDLPQTLVLVGENGSGKSTIIEALAEAYGLNPEGGSTGAMHRTFDSESGLAASTRLVRGAAAARGGYFLRAETMHSFFTYLATEAGGEDGFHRRSHGESFLDLVADRFFTPRGPRPGLFVLDEPESALSFASSLALLELLRDLLTQEGAQVVMATHSPVLAALPDATILRLDDAGFTPVAWSDLELVVGLRAFLNDPAAFLQRR